MKRLILSLTMVLFSQTNANAFSAVCSPNDTHYSAYGDRRAPNANIHKAYKRQRDFDCTFISHKGASAILSMKIIGPGLAYIPGENFILNCPGVKFEKLEHRLRTKQQWTARGLDLSASFLFGPRANIMFGSNLTPCALFGVTSGSAGASIGVSKISVKEFINKSFKFGTFE